jgi:hypothetical protein
VKTRQHTNKDLGYHRICGVEMRCEDSVACSITFGGRQISGATEYDKLVQGEHNRCHTEEGDDLGIRVNECSIYSSFYEQWRPRTVTRKKSAKKEMGTCTMSFPFKFPVRPLRFHYIRCITLPLHRRKCSNATLSWSSEISQGV